MSGKSLGKSQRDKICKLVKKGGSIVTASFSASIYDAMEVRRPNFAVHSASNRPRGVEVVEVDSKYDCADFIRVLSHPHELKFPAWKELVLARALPSQFILVCRQFALTQRRSSEIAVRF